MNAAWCSVPQQKWLKLVASEEGRDWRIWRGTNRFRQALALYGPFAPDQIHDLCLMMGKHPHPSVLERIEYGGR